MPEGTREDPPSAYTALVNSEGPYPYFSTYLIDYWKKERKARVSDSQWSYNTSLVLQFFPGRGFLVSVITTRKISGKLNLSMSTATTFL